MATTRPSSFPLLALPLLGLSAFLLSPAPASPTSPASLWDLGALKSDPPAVRWLDRDSPIHSLIYQSEPHRGQPTEVFAFYASPATLGLAEHAPPFPGIVLIHGGGGTAFADWVHLWAARGYAAIAMDLGGERPPAPSYDPATGATVGHQSDRSLRTPVDRPGPAQGHPEKFDSIALDTSAQWPYHAVASVVRAHTLLRSFDEVDPGRTAVTGISWGGYTTCLVASVDDRFQAAVPVYGCGFLHLGESVQKPSIDRLGALAPRWVERYDPSRFLPLCTVPMFFVNGTDDPHYPLDSHARSFALVQAPKMIRIRPGMRHSHTAGWAPAEIARFIDAHCLDGPPLPALGKLALAEGQVTLPYTSTVALDSAALHYTADGGPRSGRTWRSLPATVTPDSITAPAPPADANTWFLSATDQLGAMVTTPVQFAPPLPPPPPAAER